MQKIILSNENKYRIQLAMQKLHGNKAYKVIQLLSGGLSGVPIYKIEIDNQFYAIKLDNIYDENVDLKRCYAILNMVSQENLAPFVYYTDADHGIIVMEYIDSKPRPPASPQSQQQLAELIHKLHHGNSFPKWKSVIEILNYFYEKLSSSYKENYIIKQCMNEISILERYAFDEADTKPSHCDLNPSNVLFNGENYLLVDWHAASPQSFYFDLTCCTTFFYFYNENLCNDFLRYYFSRDMTLVEQNKYYLMRIFTHIYYGVIFISLSLSNNKNLNILSDEEVLHLPTYLEFMQSLGTGKINLSDAYAQQQFGFIFLMLALDSIHTAKYKEITN